MGNIVESHLVIISLKCAEIEAAQENLHLYYPTFLTDLATASLNQDLELIRKLEKQIDEVALKLLEVRQVSQG